MTDESSRSVLAEVDSQKGDGSETSLAPSPQPRALARTTTAEQTGRAKACAETNDNISDNSSPRERPNCKEGALTCKDGIPIGKEGHHECEVSYNTFDASSFRERAICKKGTNLQGGDGREGCHECEVSEARPHFATCVSRKHVTC